MKSNRMFGILCQLLDKEKVTAAELADYFEVSARTIHRDLLDLSSAGFPIVTKQGIDGGISLMSNFRYSKAALNKEELNMIFAGINSLTSINDSAKIKTLLAKLRLNSDEKLLLENDVVIDFTSWNYNSGLIEKIRIIRSAIASKTLLEIKYYSISGYSEKIIAPYKLVFKTDNWYLFGFCTKSNDYRVYKLNRMTELILSDKHFVERTDYIIPDLKNDFVSNEGVTVTAHMDASFEFLAIDLFGIENISKDENDNLTLSFQTENIEWVIQVFANLGDRAEIISPDYLRNQMVSFLQNALQRYKDQN